jgi:hypothetical protein
MDRMKPLKIIFLLLVCTTGLAAQKYNSYKGLIMAGYQGWFNTPTDGANRGWHHYGNRQGFKPGNCSIDFWPDVAEYPVTYPTPFRFRNGKPARTFSSHDSTTVCVHFGWMKEYGIDGVFMQRFISEIKTPKGKAHFNNVLTYAVAASQKYGRALSIMYDLSGMSTGDENILFDDLDALEKKYGFKSRKIQDYLYHNGKPLIAVWGIGFNDGRKYGLDVADKIIENLRQRGYSILIGVPTYWRECGEDTEVNPQLHETIRKCDIVLPWFVGRYNEKNYEAFKPNIRKDREWCAQNGVDYAPLCYPGFSWRNKRGLNSFYVDRNSGSFFWQQLVTVIEYGAEMIYIAMFDEMDEGTAIFKCVHRSNVPNNKIKFDGIEDHLPTDYYLWLTGEAGKMLRKETVLTASLPERRDMRSTQTVNSNSCK